MPTTFAPVTRNQERDLCQRSRGITKAPNLIDGGVLDATTGAVPAWFEADALAARIGGQLQRRRDEIVPASRWAWPTQ